MQQLNENLISVEEAGTLDGLFARRVHRSADKTAYTYFERKQKVWLSYTWAEMATQVARWQQAINAEDLQSGEHAAVLLRNCPEWVVFDQAAMACSLVTVPLYTDDRPDNVAYILEEADVKLLVVQDAGRWKRLAEVIPDDCRLRRVILLDDSEQAQAFARDDERIRIAADWLPEDGGRLQPRKGADPYALASIIYTSGTTGRPKGVMLSHHNMLSVAHAGVTKIDIYEQDVFLSFLPLSHTLERTGGYYLPVMTGSRVAYARSVSQLADDLRTIRPTAMIAVPRIFERVYGRVKDQMAKKPPYVRRLFDLTVDVGWQRFLRQQGRGGRWTPKLLLWPLLRRVVASKITDALGGQLRVAVSGGAPLTPEIARIFIGLGVQIIQGYGLTETSPVVSVNSLEDNVPDSVGTVIRGTQVRIGEHDELLVKGPGVMLGYWNNHAATAQMIDSQGWLHTGDQARIGERGHLYITGRLKDILVLSNGEKIPPADMEMSIAMDGLVEQVMVVGEGRPYLTALVVLNADNWPGFAQDLGLDPLLPESLNDARVHSTVRRRIKEALSEFPGYAKIRQVSLTLEPWTIDEGLVTPTLKVKRPKVLARYENEVKAMYEGGPAGS